MRIVVVGAGKVGRVLTEQLAAEKHDIVVIDQDSDLIESIVNIYDVRGVAGNGGCYDVQKDAFEDGADLLHRHHLQRRDQYSGLPCGKKNRYTAYYCAYP